MTIENWIQKGFIWGFENFYIEQKLTQFIRINKDFCIFGSNYGEVCFLDYTNRISNESRTNGDLEKIEKWFNSFDYTFKEADT